MGLLTDTKQRQRLVKLIVKYHQKLSVLLYLVGLLWFLALAYQPFNAGTYFSENALLPGLVESDIPQEFTSLSSFVENLSKEMEKDKNKVPKDWIFQQFQNLGLDTYRHNFTIKYPFRIAFNEDIVGENIYAILRARRASRTEALVMSVPMRPAGAGKLHTDGGIALMLGLAEQFRYHPYWAKDVIFLLTDFDEVGVQAWLDAYHETQSPYVIAGDLPGRSGAIQAAINLELPRDKIRYLNLKVEGLNGQLPNLDLFNLAVKLAWREHVPVTLQQRSDHHDPESVDGFQHSLGTLLRMMWSQASGAPSGNHGLFHRFHIEALTIQGVSLKKGLRKYSLDRLSVVVEGIFRSLNNLLERFHQSFFFYLLPSTNRYISIGLYMPPFGCLAMAGVVKALALWIVTHSQSDEEDSTDKKSEGERQEGGMEDTTKGREDIKEVPDATEKTTDSKAQKRKHDDISQSDSTPCENQEGSDSKKSKMEEIEDETADSFEDEDSDSEEETELTQVNGMMTVIPVVMVSFLLGMMAYTAPKVLNAFTPASRMRAEDTILFGILAVFSAALAYPKLMQRKFQHEEHFALDWKLLKCVGLIIQGLMLFAISLVNISLAFFHAVLLVPVTTMVVATQNRLLRIIQLTLLLLVSPIGMLGIAAVTNVLLEGTAKSFMAILAASWNELKQLLFLMLVDQYLFTSWTYTVINFAILPTWLLFWVIPFCDR